MSHFLYQHNTYCDSRHENTGRSTILYSLVACFSVPLFAIVIVTVGVVRPLSLRILEQTFDQPSFVEGRHNAIRRSVIPV